MPFTLPDLPFDRSALGEFMSAETLEFHHGKQHNGYVDKVNEAVAEADRAGGAHGEVWSAETLECHHGKHHKAYVDKVNAAVAEKDLAGASLSEVIRAAG